MTKAHASPKKLHCIHCQFGGLSRPLDPAKTNNQMSPVSCKDSERQLQK